MKPLGLQPIRVKVADPAPLIANARILALPRDVDTADPQLRWVGFRLGGHRCALDLALMTRAVARLGEVVPLLGAGPRIRGVAFIDNVPHVVADLREAAGAPGRGRTALAEAPALVVAREGWRVAVAVDGPLDLVEGEQLRPAEVVDLGGGIEVAGSQPSGAMVLASAWFRGWVEALAPAH